MNSNSTESSVTNNKNNKQNIPKLRFKEFSDEWKKVPAGEIFKNVTNKNHDGTLPILAVTQDQGVVCRDSLDMEIKTSTKSIKSYKIIEPGDFVISLRSFQGGIEYSTIKGICSPAYTILKPKSDIFDDFYKFYLKKEEFISRLNYAVIGIRDGKQISYKDFSEIKIPYTSVKEQKKISEYLDVIDAKISLLKREYGSFLDYKKYLLQNIFSQKLRFNKNCYYENKKVRDFLVESKIKGIDDIHKRLTVKLNLKGIFPREVKTTEVEGATKQFIRKSGQFIYGKQNLHKGAFGIIPEELDGYLSSSDIPSFDFKKGMDPKWFYYYFSRESFYENLEKLSTGTGSKRISPKDFLNIKILVPDLEEQKKISDCLFTIDTKIDLIEDQISHMEEFKKGLLQSLFI